MTKQEQIEFHKSEIARLEGEIKTENASDIIPYGTELAYGQPILVSDDKKEWFERLFIAWDGKQLLAHTGEYWNYAGYDREAVASNWLPNNGKMPDAKKVIVRFPDGSTGYGEPKSWNWSTILHPSLKEYMVIEP